MNNGKIIFRFYKNKIIVQVKASGSENINYFYFKGTKFYKISNCVSLSEGYSQLISYIKQTNSIDATGYESICVFLNQEQPSGESLPEVISDVDNSSGMFFSTYKFYDCIESFLKAVKTDLQKGSNNIFSSILFTDRKSDFLKCGSNDEDSYFLLGEDDILRKCSHDEYSILQKDYEEYFIDESTFEKFILGNLTGANEKTKGFIEQYPKENKENEVEESPLSEMIRKYGAVINSSSN